MEVIRSRKALRAVGVNYRRTATISNRKRFQDGLARTCKGSSGAEAPRIGAVPPLNREYSSRAGPSAGQPLTPFSSDAQAFDRGQDRLHMPGNLDLAPDGAEHALPIDEPG